MQLKTSHKYRYLLSKHCHYKMYLLVTYLLFYKLKFKQAETAPIFLETKLRFI